MGRGERKGWTLIVLRGAEHSARRFGLGRPLLLLTIFLGLIALGLGIAFGLAVRRTSGSAPSTPSSQAAPGVQDPSSPPLRGR